MPTVGEIRVFAADFVPAGWAECDGKILGIEGNEAIFEVIGFTYGSEGRSFFALPDLRGRRAVGAGPDHALGSNGVDAATGTGDQGYLAMRHVICLEGDPPSDGVKRPPGRIMLFSGEVPPKGWVACDGQLLAIAEHPALFSLLGTIYGGDGRTTFGLPDLRGHSPVGATLGAGGRGQLALGARGQEPSGRGEGASGYLGLSYLISTEPPVIPGGGGDEEPWVAEIELSAANFVPRGWAAAQGQLLPIAANDVLFALIGPTYGGDGRTTFALPDLSARSAIGVGEGSGLPDYEWGQSGFYADQGAHERGYLGLDYLLALQGVFPKRS